MNGHLVQTAVPKPRVPSRAGWTLVETLIVITFTSLLLGLVATFMQGILQINGTLQRDLKLRTAVSRLDRQFRSDARAAIDCSTDAALPHTARDGTARDESTPNESTPNESTPNESDQVRLRISEQHQIVYRSESGMVHREVTQHGKRTDVDGFHLPRGVRVAWRTDRQRSGPLIQLIIDDQRSQDASKGVNTPRQIIMAHVGADQRLRTSGVP